MTTPALRAALEATPEQLSEADHLIDLAWKSGKQYVSFTLDMAQALVTAARAAAEPEAKVTPSIPRGCPICGKRSYHHHRAPVSR